MKKTIILTDLLSRAKEDKLFDYRGGFPHIPEIAMQSEHVCAELIEALQKEKLNNLQFLTVATAWCAYAGMGAVAKWNDNWRKLKRKGIVKSLTKERGIFAMDEYVMDYIGIGWGTEECETLHSKLLDYGEDYLTRCFEKNSYGEIDLNPNYFFEYLQAYYLFGMVYEMSRLGMH